MRNNNEVYMLCFKNSLDYFLPQIICLPICVYQRAIVLPCPASIPYVSPVMRVCLSTVYSHHVDSLIVFLAPQVYYHGLIILSLSSQACYQVELFPIPIVTSKQKVKISSEH